jgi:tRNA(adenine34) deaminase
MIFNNTFMQQAWHLAKKAYELDEVPVGAVIVQNDIVIASGYNLCRSNFDITLHAEIIAIREAQKLLQSHYLTDCHIYTTLEPCAMCAQAISFAKLKRLYYGAPDPKSGAVDNNARIFSSSSCHHKPEVYGHIMEAECGDLLKEFFKTKRD